jgi:hypothetical protein
MTMERTEVLDMMGSLKLYGMRSAHEGRFVLGENFAPMHHFQLEMSTLGGAHGSCFLPEFLRRFSSSEKRDFSPTFGDVYSELLSASFGVLISFQAEYEEFDSPSRSKCTENN